MTTRTIELPAPRELKMTLTEALKARKTIRSFTTEPISDADLSTLLWCTAGITRPDGKRTVPSCLDLRTVSVCVLRADGAWRWNASKNTLELLTPEDLRAASTMGQHAFVDTAPVTLVFVVEATPRTQMARPHWAYLDAGTMVEAAYLAGTALGLGGAFHCRRILHACADAAARSSADGRPRRLRRRGNALHRLDGASSTGALGA